jgi:hypothetical protein
MRRIAVCIPMEVYDGMPLLACALFFCVAMIALVVADSSALATGFDASVR